MLHMFRNCSVAVLNYLVQPLAAGFAQCLCFELLMLDLRPYRVHARGVSTGHDRTFTGLWEDT